MPMAPRPNSMGLPASSNMTSYWSNRRACDPALASSALAAANPDTEPDSPVAADSGPKALFRIQTGQNPLSAEAKNFVPQTGQVRDSCSTAPRWVPRLLTGFRDCLFAALAVIRSDQSRRRAREPRAFHYQRGSRNPRPPDPLAFWRYSA